MSFATLSSPPSLADRIENLLPQTQCTKCGYAACRPYAEAIATGAAGYDQCPPGGAAGVARLAALLGRPVVPLNAEAHGPERPRPVARIDESVCIGCTLCIQACPVDAIAGAAKRMHTVIESLCTGCDLCVAPCPVDCIEMVPVTGAATGWDAWTPAQAEAARGRHDRRLAREQREREDAERRVALRHAAHRAKAEAVTIDPASGKPATGLPKAEVAHGNNTGRSAHEATPPTEPGVPAALSPDERKRAIIQAALERARVKKAELAGHGIAPKNTVAVSAAVQAQIDEADARRKRLGIDIDPDVDPDVNPDVNTAAKPSTEPNARSATDLHGGPDVDPASSEDPDPASNPSPRS